MTVQKEQVMEPRSEAGRTMIYPLLRGDALAGDVRKAVIAIEADARAATLDALSDAVKGLAAIHVPMPRAQRGDRDYGLNDPKLVYADRVLALIDNLRESDRG